MTYLFHIAVDPGGEIKLQKIRYSIVSVTQRMCATYTCYDWGFALFGNLILAFISGAIVNTN